MQSNTAAATMTKVAPEQILTQIAFGAMMTQALGVAAKFGIADLLHENQKSVGELAAATETDERSLYRVLRSLAGAGIFSEVESNVFANTKLSDLLRKEPPNSMRNTAIFMAEPWHFSTDPLNPYSSAPDFFVQSSTQN